MADSFVFGPAASLPITRHTPFRQTGDVPRTVWEEHFAAVDSPVPARDVRAMHGACLGVQALVLDRLRVESWYGTTETGRHNILGLRPPSGAGASTGFMSFASYVECVNELMRRWSDPAYKNGVYGPEDLSLEGMLTKYSPSFENDTEALIVTAVDNINTWRGRNAEPGEDVNWSPLPYPPMTPMIVQKPAYDGAGFTRVAARGPRIVGVCDHITDGEGTPAWYAQFFGTGGERAWDALVDVVIGRSDTGLLNDWRDPQKGGTRAGWANGGEGADTPRGREFYKHYPAINDVLVSKEHVTVSGRALNDYQIETSAQLTAAVAHNESRCPWHTFPRHPGKHNVEVSLIHTDFAAKSCPAEPFISTHRPVILRLAKEILTRQQTGSSNPNPPAQAAPEPEPAYPFGFTEETIAFFWGTLTRDDGAAFAFDPQGMLSLLWLKRCEVEGRFPEAESWVRVRTAQGVARDVVQWEGGWTAIRDDVRGTFTWIDKGAPEPKAVTA